MRDDGAAFPPGVTSASAAVPDDGAGGGDFAVPWAAALRESRAMRALPFLVVLAACAPAVDVPEGVVGEEGVVVFQAENPTILEARTRLVVGSAFDVVAVPRRDASLDGAVFASSDDAVAKVVAADVGAGRVEIVGAGAAALVVKDQDGEELDRVEVRAAVPERRSLVEAQLLGTSIDARVPPSFGVVASEDVDVYVAAVDRCGGDLLDWGASAPASEDEAVLAVERREAGGFTLAPIAAGETVVTIATPGVDEPVSYEVRVVDPELVDDVVPTAAAAGKNSVELWGRAFAGSDEIVGLTYGWTGTARVSLSAARGPTTVATIAGVGDDQPVEGDAIATASALDEEGELNLLALRDTDLTSSRLPPEAGNGGVVAQPTGCGGGATAPCDPAAATLAVLGLRAIRRRR